MRLAIAFRAMVIAASVFGLAGASARADMILQQYDFANESGTEASVATSFIASGLSGMDFARSSVLSGSSAAGFISSSGWQNAGAAYFFGLNVSAGQSVMVSRIDFASRSSNTGPGFLNIMASIDGAAALKVGSFTQSGTDYNDLQLAIAPVMAFKSLVFSIVAANTTSANGGTTAGTGTFRIGNYAPGGNQVSPFTLNGTIQPAAGPVAVPEPASCLLVGMGLIGCGVVARRRTASQ